MKKLTLIFFMLTCMIIYSQTNLYIPRNVQDAVENKTRTLTGLPGENYWLNKAEYKIEAKILPDKSYLIGDEVIKYHNNSPDTLKRIVVRLYQDITKTGALRDWYIPATTLVEGTKINYIVIDNDTVNLGPQSREIFRGSTNLSIFLKNKIAPGNSSEIKIGWEFEIPTKFRVRMGNYGNDNLYLAYWYPEIAVYDDINGWDMIDYKGSVEFYNDFSDFDIKIDIPKGIMVWGTGDLVNGKEVLRKDIFEKYEKAKTSEKVIRIITQEDYEKGSVTAENETNTWHFKAKDVPAVAYATSRNFNWDGVSALVDKSTGRRALTAVLYADTIVNYDNGAQIAKETIEYLSHEIPGFPYQYSHSTSYSNGNRGGGMESPMMANNGAPRSMERFIGLIFHEIAHNYFPFMMGTNERKYAWMDEGWATFLPTDIIKKHVPDSKYRENQMKSYERLAGVEADLPLITPSYSYKTGLGRLGFYGKPFTAYFELYEYLGDETFRQCMKEYCKRWVGKHPIPYDFFFTFNEVSGEDLSWFWKTWFFEYGYPDLSIDKVNFNDEELSVSVKMLGSLPTRVNLKFEFEDGDSIEVAKPASIWKDSKSVIELKLKPVKKVKSITLGNNTIPDVNRENNVYKVN